MNFAQKFLYPINIMPTDRQVEVSRFSFKTSAGAACCGRDGMVDIPDLKSGGRMPVRVQVPPPAPKLSLFISVLLGNFGKKREVGLYGLVTAEGVERRSLFHLSDGRWSYSKTLRISSKY